jgi:hypothetical protein
MKSDGRRCIQLYKSKDFPSSPYTTRYPRARSLTLKILFEKYIACSLGRVLSTEIIIRLNFQGTYIVVQP